MKPIIAFIQESQVCMLSRMAADLCPMNVSAIIRALIEVLWEVYVGRSLERKSRMKGDELRAIISGLRDTAFNERYEADEAFVVFVDDSRFEMIRLLVDDVRSSGQDYSESALITELVDVGWQVAIDGATCMRGLPNGQDWLDRVRDAARKAA